MLWKVIKTNWDDFALCGGVVGGVFLLIQAVIGGVMHVVKPGDGILISGIALPIMAGFMMFIVAFSHVSVLFEMTLRFGQTRRRALGLILGLDLSVGAFSMALAAFLAAAERFVSPSLWAWLAGAESWVLSTPVAVPAYMAESGARWVMGANGLEQVSPNTLILESFNLPWWWYPLILAIGLAAGLVFGTLLQRFGSKGLWVMWAAVMVPSLGTQLLPWRTHEITNWLWPLLIVIAIAALIWSVWSLLHTVVRT